MKIGIIGTGNIGATLGLKLQFKHEIVFAVRDKSVFKNKEMLEKNANLKFVSIAELPQLVEVLIMAIPAETVAQTCSMLGDVSHLIIIDTMNKVMKDLGTYQNVTEIIMANTNTTKLVKAFNCIGFEHIHNASGKDMYVAGTNEEAKKTAMQLATDVGFETVYDFGDSKKITLLENFAYCWINLAIMQKNGRSMYFKLTHS